ncbi:MAG: sigma-54 interaction domain-containing protein [Bacillota bacterium]|jgi:arginine utilization regulatory protein
MDLAGRETPKTLGGGAQKLAKSLSDMMPNPDDYSSLVNSAALSVINEGIHIVNSAGVTIFYNAAMGAIEGIDPERVLGLPLRKVFPHLNPENSTLLKVLETGEPIYDVAQTYKTPAGDLVTTVNSTMPIIVHGKCVAAMEVAKTISRVRHLSQKLLQVQGTKPPATGPRRTLRPNYTMYTFDDVLGVSPLLLHAKSLAESAARTDSPVLIWGETGTGKELFAQSIHNASPRSAGLFVAVNCSALPESLAESMLFGTAKGAFTGAMDKEGLFEQAGGGTLFLDEVVSASPTLQSKLLRAVEEQAVRRIGGNRLIPVNVRVIAAANCDPMLAVRQGRLRSDLYYRLAAISIELPPLRARREDIPVLVRKMTETYAQNLGMKAPEYSQEALERLIAYDWPGNVRELRNAVESALTLSSGKRVITAADLPRTIREDNIDIAGASVGGTVDDRIALAEARFIQEALEKTGGNISRAARELGISRQSLYYRMAKHGIDKSPS